MDPTAAFAELVAASGDRLRLDVGAALIAAHAHPGLDVDGVVAGLDSLAASCPGRGIDELRHHLFAVVGFRGNRAHYDDPRNSLLDEVLARRLGIPITLSVVTIEVGRRLGLRLEGVGMPGHFLVRHGEGEYLDPFDGGTVLDAAGCRAQFHAIVGVDAPWDPAFLRPVGPVAILARMLANLARVYDASGSPADLGWVLRLRAALPGLGEGPAVEVASGLAALGRYGEAAAVLERSAAEGPAGDELRRRAVHLRARLN